MGVIGKIFLSFLVLLSLLPEVYAEDVTARLTVDRTQLTIGESLEIQLTVDGSSDSSEPIFKNQSDFEIQASGSSSQFQFINGKRSVSKIFHYLAFPKKIGILNLGPFSVEVDGKSIESNTIKISAYKDNSSDSKTTPKDKFYYLEAELLPKTLYKGQQAIYVLRFYRRARLSDANLELPEFKHFWKEKDIRFRDRSVVKNGIEWILTEIRLPVYADKVGAFDIRPSRIQAEFVLKRERGRRSRFDSLFGNDSMFGLGIGGQTKKVRLESKALTVEVLPVPGKLENTKFSGLVGTFESASELSSNNIKAGESVTLTLKVSGDGNLRDLDLKLPDISEIKVYPDESKLEENYNGQNLTMTKTFKFALVASSEGEYKIPEIKILYFDPITKALSEIVFPEKQITVQKGDGENTNHYKPGSPVSKGKEVKILGDDILPIKEQVNSVLVQTKTFLNAVVFFLVFYLIGFFVFKSFYLKRHALFADPRHLKKSRAFTRFTDTLNTWKGDFDLDGLSLALRSYIGDKLGFDGASITAQELSSRNLLSGIDQELSERLISILGEFERFQFAPGAYSGDFSSLREKVKRIVDELERGIK